MERLFNHQTIDEFLLDITETAEYKRIEYLIFSIRMNYLHYMAISRIVKFEIPKYLENLIGIVIDKFNESGISTVDMLQYMLDNDINNWIHYYAYTFIIPVAKGEENEAVNDLSELYAFVLTGYILDTFREKRIDIKNLVEGQVLAHKTNNEDSTGANVFGEGETDASRLYKMGEGEFLSEKLPFPHFYACSKRVGITLPPTPRPFRSPVG